MIDARYLIIALVAMILALVAHYFPRWLAPLTLAIAGVAVAYAMLFGVT